MGAVSLQQKVPACLPRKGSSPQMGTRDKATNSTLPGAKCPGLQCIAGPKAPVVHTTSLCVTLEPYL